MRLHRLAAPLFVITHGLAALGCIDTDPTVFVEGTIESPQASVESSSLSTGFSGSFQVTFHLGPRAADQSEVTLGGISITNADQTATIVPVLAVTTTPSFPVAVLIDSDKVVNFDFTAEDNLLDTDAESALCANTVRIVGVFEGSLRGASFTPASDPFTVAGCP